MIRHAKRVKEKMGREEGNGESVGREMKVPSRMRENERAPSWGVIWSLYVSYEQGQSINRMPLPADKMHSEYRQQITQIR